MLITLPFLNRAIAEYLSRDLMYQLSADDVYLIVRCSQAIEIILSVLARPGANILLPKPGYPFYDVRAAFSHLQVRHSGLLSDQSWEIDLESVEALADENTVAIVIISPGNPCGNVFTYQHLEKVAETAKKLGILVIADEVYHRIVFGSDPFVPMGEFGSIVPVVTLGSISKTWIVPGWRIGWIVTNDPSDDVYLIVGCSQAIEIILSVLARPGANILLPKPGYPFYDVRAAFSHLQVRHSGLLSDQSWEIDLESVEALADENTVAIVIISPGNPCGNVFTYQHLEKVAEPAKKLGILVIADEVYHRIVFGSDPFVPMGEFGSIVPVVTLGSISKTWIVPGWRIGWIVTNEPSGILENFGGAVAQILENTKDDFFSKIINIIKEAANICYDRIKEIPCLTCPHKPAGSMSVMANLNLSLLEDISDDMDFCFKLAKEESVIVLSGCVVGMKNWIRLTFAIDPASLEEGLSSYKFFRRQIGNNYKFFIQVMEVLLLSKLFKHLCSLSEISP
ncbi:putative aminotransferase tat2 [Quercus suber]|uniref:Aminotransferase tat2 n=1 Tax=Quercus suber TaxID=58331 RepID=A0AAW0M8S3_QUESU